MMQSIKHYRAFQVDPDGHVFGCINLVCDDDDDAKRQAASLVLVHRIELWRLDKRIAQFDRPINFVQAQAVGSSPAL
jgi:hypothetical protein